MPPRSGKSGSKARSKRTRLTVRDAESLAQSTYERFVRRLIDDRVQVGDLVPGENDLVAEYGVPLSVARKVFADLAAAGLVLRARGRGSILAKPLRFAAATVVRLLAPDAFAWDRAPWLMEFLGGFETTLAAHGVYSHLHTVKQAAAALGVVLPGAPMLPTLPAVTARTSATTSLLRPESWQSVLVLGQPSDVPTLSPLVAALQVEGANVLQVAPILPDLPWVGWDEVAAGRQGARHLIDFGHRRLAFIGWSNAPWATVQGARLEGVQAELAAAGLDAPQVRLFVHAAGGNTTAPSDPAALGAAMRDFAAAGITGIVTVHDHLTHHVCEAAAAVGLSMPRTFSVIGFDDTHRWRPQGYSVVRYPWSALGERAATILLGLESGATLDADSYTVATTVIRRHSTRAIDA